MSDCTNILLPQRYFNIIYLKLNWNASKTKSVSQLNTWWGVKLYHDSTLWHRDIIYSHSSGTRGSVYLFFCEMLWDKMIYLCQNLFFILLRGNKGETGTEARKI